MKRLIALFLFLGIFHQGNAQSIFFEVGGPGIASLNFDTRFTKNNKGIGGRLGFGGFKVSDVGVLFFPIGVNYLLGRDQKNFFELGVGFTPLLGFGDIDSQEPFSTSFGHFLFGYRRVDESSGFQFRIFLSPIFARDFFLSFYGGLSFGYQFRRK
ncbi:MAG: hypothetical protein N2747_05245 [Chitinophagaceae bacterium]|nr:hypothetical protein [Chitinophagaceae bacterium]